MALRIVECQETPNPAALKFIVDPAPRELPDVAMRSYGSAPAAAGDPLARALFEIPGVANVLIVRNWITINRAANGEWRTMKPLVKRMLESAE